MQLNYRTSTRVTFCLFAAPHPTDLHANGSNDVDSRKNVPFVVQVVAFHIVNSRPPIRLKGNNLENFRKKKPRY